MAKTVKRTAGVSSKVEKPDLAAGQAAQVLSKLLSDDMTAGNRVAIQRTIQILRGER